MVAIKHGSSVPYLNGAVEFIWHGVVKLILDDYVLF